MQTLRLTQVYVPTITAPPTALSGVCYELGATAEAMAFAVGQANAWLLALDVTANRYSTALATSDFNSAALQQNTFNGYLTNYMSASAIAANDLSCFRTLIDTLAGSLGTAPDAYIESGIAYLVADGSFVKEFYSDLGISDAEIQQIIDVTVSNPLHPDIGISDGLTNLANDYVTNVPEPSTFLLMCVSIVLSSLIYGLKRANLYSSPKWQFNLTIGTHRRIITALLFMNRDIEFSRLSRITWVATYAMRRVPYFLLTGAAITILIYAYDLRFSQTGVFRPVLIGSIVFAFELVVQLVVFWEWINTCRIRVGSNNISFAQKSLGRGNFVVPYISIKNVEVRRNVLSRILGISDILIRYNDEAPPLIVKGFSNIGVVMNPGEALIPAQPTDRAILLADEIKRASGRMIDSET